MQNLLTIEIKRFKCIMLSFMVDKTPLCGNRFCFGSSSKCQLLRVIFEPNFVSQILFVIIFMTHSNEFISRDSYVAIQYYIIIFVDIFVIKRCIVFLSPSSSIQELMRTDQFLRWLWKTSSFSNGGISCCVFLQLFLEFIEIFALGYVILNINGHLFSAHRHVTFFERLFDFNPVKINIFEFVLVTFEWTQKFF